MQTRCKFCARKLDEKGLCQNPKCADHTRTKIIESESKNTEDNE